MLIDKNGYYLYKSDNFYEYVIFMQTIVSIMTFLISILLLLAVLVISTKKNSCVLVYEDYRYNKKNT